jgi:hypothetical protein
MNDEQIAEHSNRIFVEHERLKREAANLRDELKQAEAGRDHLRGLLTPATNALNFMVNEQHSCPLEHFEDFEKVPYCEVPEMEDVGDCSSSPAECWKMHLNGWCGCDLDELLQIAKQIEVEDDREVDAP